MLAVWAFEQTIRQVLLGIVEKGDYGSRKSKPNGPNRVDKIDTNRGDHSKSLARYGWILRVVNISAGVGPVWKAYARLRLRTSP